MKARTHHFQMKYLVAQMALQSPQRFMDRFRPGGDAQFFADLWTAVGRELDPAERVLNTGASVWHRPAERGAAELVVLTFPAPAAIGEAYFVGALKTSERCRVFCLEHALNPMTQHPSTMLSELAANGRANWGEVSASRIEEFVSVVDGIANDPEAMPNSFVPMRLA